MVLQNYDIHDSFGQQCKLKLWPWWWPC